MDDDNIIVGQWEVYDGGVVLRYDEQHPQDQHGKLADQPFDPVEAAPEGVEEMDAASHAGATNSLKRQAPS